MPKYETGGVVKYALDVQQQRHQEFQFRKEVWIWLLHRLIFGKMSPSNSGKNTDIFLLFLPTCWPTLDQRKRQVDIVRLLHVVIL